MLVGELAFTQQQPIMGRKLFGGEREKAVDGGVRAQGSGKVEDGEFGALKEEQNRADETARSFSVSSRSPALLPDVLDDPIYGLRLDVVLARYISIPPYLILFFFPFILFFLVLWGVSGPLAADTVAGFSKLPCQNLRAVLYRGTRQHIALRVAGTRELPRYGEITE